MKFNRTLFIGLGLLVLSVSAMAQRRAPRPKAVNPKPIIFGVINDGVAVEPIAYINKGKLEVPANGSDDGGVIGTFVKSYYKPGTTYRLIFGGADAGTVRVKSGNAVGDCAKNMGNVTVSSSKVAIKGFVMGLATNAPKGSKAAGLRRKPTTQEKAEIDALVKAEYQKNKLTPKLLHYQNLTAIDVDGNGTVELVGSYWIEVDRLTRALLFFIADKNSKGKYSISFSDYRSVDQNGTMSGDIKDVDKGIYHELLLDYYDVDGDGTAEIFTYIQSFEGAEFNVYHRTGQKWTKMYDFSNYHCGY